MPETGFSERNRRQAGSYVVCQMRKSPEASRFSVKSPGTFSYACAFHDMVSLQPSAAFPAQSGSTALPLSKCDLFALLCLFPSSIDFRFSAAFLIRSACAALLLSGSIGLRSSAAFLMQSSFPGSISFHCSADAITQRSWHIRSRKHCPAETTKSKIRSYPLLFLYRSSFSTITPSRL